MMRKLFKYGACLFLVTAGGLVLTVRYAALHPDSAAAGIVGSALTGVAQLNLMGWGLPEGSEEDTTEAVKPGATVALADGSECQIPDEPTAIEDASDAVAITPCARVMPVGEADILPSGWYLQHPPVYVPPTPELMPLPVAMDPMIELDPPCLGGGCPVQSTFDPALVPCKGQTSSSEAGDVPSTMPPCPSDDETPFCPAEHKKLMPRADDEGEVSKPQQTSAPSTPGFFEFWKQFFQPFAFPGQSEASEAGATGGKCQEDEHLQEQYPGCPVMGKPGTKSPGFGLIQYDPVFITPKMEWITPASRKEHTPGRHENEYHGEDKSTAPTGPGTMESRPGENSTTGSPAPF